jgi:23S rRNA-/tRNA-specific pseudouridylate synthase
MQAKSKRFSFSKLSISYFILFSVADGGFTLPSQSSFLSARAFHTFCGETTSQSIHGHPISVVYESDRMLAIDKPHDIPHHDGGGKNDLGILSVLRQAQSRGDLEYQGRLYGVHRLDRVTSGILLLAKDAEMASVLTKAFREGNVTKYYVGISNKKRTKKKQGWVKGNMVRGRRKAWYLTREMDETATNMAVTRFFTANLAPFRESALDQQTPPMTCILFRPFTGRTHQLRVAAKSVGLPLAGDPIYSDGSTGSLSERRTCLHASAIHVDLREHEHETVSIWSPPSFASHLYQAEEDRSGLNNVVIQLMQKNCNCESILELVDQYHRLELL